LCLLAASLGRAPDGALADFTDRAELPAINNAVAGAILLIVAILAIVAIAIDAAPCWSRLLYRSRDRLRDRIQATDRPRQEPGLLCT
jgi:hypothetical protein